MNCSVCPNCGFDLDRFEPVNRGELTLLAHEVRWKGKRIRLRTAGRLMVSAIVRANGLPVSLSALSEAMGCTEESDNPFSIVRTQIYFARKAFREVDPSFSAIKTIWGVGVRWDDSDEIQGLAA